MSNPDILSEDDPNYWPPYEYAMPIARPVSSELPKAAAAPPSPATVVEPLAAQLSPSASTPESAPRDAEPTARGRASQSASGARTYGHHASGSATLALRLPNLNAPDMFPAFMSRSALFGAFRPNTGGSLAGDIQAAGAATIAFQGPRLSMLDKRVWEALVRLAKAGRLNVSEPFDVPLAAIAAESGLAKSSTRAAWLSMQRLAAARVDAIVEGARCEGLLLAEARRCGNHCSAKLDPAFAIPALSEVLLAAMPATPVRFGSSPLSQWLLDFFSTHEQAEKPFTLDYLRSLSGYGSIAKHFPSDLRKALASLKARAPEIVEDFSIEERAGGSGLWRLSITRGPAKPVVKHRPKPNPAAASPLVEACFAQGSKVQPRPRGPAL